MRDRAAACLRFTLRLLSLDGDEASECGQTGKARRDANQHCCGSPANNTHPREPSKQSCNHTTTSSSTPKSHKPPKDSFSCLSFHILSFVSVHAGTKSMSFTLCPSAGTFRSFIICSVYLSFPSLPGPTFSPLQCPIIFSSSYRSQLTSAFSHTSHIFLHTTNAC